MAGPETRCSRCDIKLCIDSVLILLRSEREKYTNSDELLTEVAGVSLLIGGSVMVSRDIYSRIPKARHLANRPVLISIWD